MAAGCGKRILMDFIHCFKYFLVLSAFWIRNADVDAAVAKNSSPFDPFRLECPFFHAIVRVDLQRVESSEGVRTDTMITSFCENIRKLFPSPRDPTLTTADEDCRWTENFKIPGESFDFTDTCSGREFVSGISRQSFGEYGILCCKIKDRKKGNCNTVEFRLPTVNTPSVGVESGKRILTGIGHNNGRLIAQFCDMEIMNKREVDEDFIANARARLLSQGEEDKVRNPTIRTDGDANRPVPIAARPNTKAPTRLSSPGIRPPAGFAQPRNRPAQNFPSLGNDDDDDSQKPANIISKNENSISRQAVVKNSLSAPAFEPPGTNSGRPATAKRPTGGSASAKVATVSKTAKPSGRQESDDDRPTGLRTVKTTRKPTSTTEAAEGDNPESESDDGGQTPTGPLPTKLSEVVAVTDGAILPDPAHFQVLGIPRPIGSDPLPKPKVQLIRTVSDGDDNSDPGSFGGSISAGGSVSGVGKQSSLPPAPPVRHEITSPPIEPDDGESSLATTPSADSQASNAEGDRPADDEKTETERPKSNKPVTGKSTGKQSDEKAERSSPDQSTAVINAGNVSAISNGFILKSNNVFESAVAPAKPLFTIPPPPKAVFGQNPARNSIPAVPDRQDVFTTESTTVRTTTGIGRLECHSNSAWRDPSSGLVVACGQGDEIWVPSRCRPGLLCLLGKDSSYRLCCSVRVP